MNARPSASFGTCWLRSRFLLMIIQISAGMTISYMAHALVFTREDTHNLTLTCTRTHTHRPLSLSLAYGQHKVPWYK